MKLYVYRRCEAENLSDTHKVAAWFLTQMFRDAGEDSTLTIDTNDFNHMYFGKVGLKLKVEKLNRGPLSKVFVFAIYGPRVAVRIHPHILKIEKSRVGVHASMAADVTYLEEDHAIRIATYLHAALNFMDSWYMKEGESIFKPEDYNGKFKPYSKRKNADSFSFDNLSGLSNRGKYERKKD